MQDLYVCNVASNYISKVNVESNKEEKIYISKEEKILGSHGIDVNNEKLYVAASDNFNFYEVDLLDKHKSVKNYYIGTATNDLKRKNDYMYLICSESNCLAIYDMAEDRLAYEIKCGNYPHSMDICDKNNYILVTNMHNNELTIVDYNTNDLVRSIRTGNLPMKSKFSRDGKYIFVCESNLGYESNGTFSVYDVSTGSKIKSIVLDKAPIDMCFDYEDNIAFVSNHLGNGVSIVDLNEFNEIMKIDVEGMPRGLYKNGRFLYVVLSDREKIFKYDMYTHDKIYINVGSEPTEIYSY